MAGAAVIEDERVEALGAGFSGVLLRAGDDGYENARRVHNGLVDKRPALIACCRGTADIVAAIALARESGLEISVRGGGHNVAGKAVTDGGVMIDLSLMKGMHVDAAARTVRAQGGVLWHEFNRETALHGLATTGGVISTTGIAGLTLGGGVGWLMGKHGLAVDNLLSVELVTADGRVLEVSDANHPDLFWALRGGGGNFGVAASLEYVLHPLVQVYGGLVAYPFDAARDVLQFFRDFTQSIPDELMVVGGFTHAPDGSGMPLAAIVVCHSGSTEQAEADLRPLLDFGAPVVAEVGPMPYPVVNTMLDAGYPFGALNYWKTSFMHSLDDDAIDAMIETFTACPSPMSGMFMEIFHGEATRVDPTATAVQHRTPGYNFLVTSVWTDHAKTDENVAWARETYDAIKPAFEDRRWLNYLDADDAEDAVRAAYGRNYDRLAAIKQQYDPENVFRLNHNIEPAGA